MRALSAVCAGARDRGRSARSLLYLPSVDSTLGENRAESSYGSRKCAPPYLLIHQYNNPFPNICPSISHADPLVSGIGRLKKGPGGLALSRIPPRRMEESTGILFSYAG